MTEEAEFEAARCRVRRWFREQVTMSLEPYKLGKRQPRVPCVAGLKLTPEILADHDPCRPTLRKRT